MFNDINSCINFGLLRASHFCHLFFCIFLNHFLPISVRSLWSSKISKSQELSNNQMSVPHLDKEESGMGRSWQWKLRWGVPIRGQVSLLSTPQTHTPTQYFKTKRVGCGSLMTVLKRKIREKRSPRDIMYPGVCI